MLSLSLLSCKKKTCSVAQGEGGRHGRRESNGEVRDYEKKLSSRSTTVTTPSFRLLFRPQRDLQVNSRAQSLILPSRKTTSSCVRWQMRASQRVPARPLRGGTRAFIAFLRTHANCVISLCPSLPPSFPPQNVNSPRTNFVNYNVLLQGAYPRVDRGRDQSRNTTV